MPLYKRTDIRPPWVLLCVCGAIFIALIITNWHTNTWSFGAYVLGLASLLVPMFTVYVMQANADRRAKIEWVERAESLDPTLKRPSARPEIEFFAWGLGGGILGAAFGWLVVPDLHIPAFLVSPLLILLPVISGYLGFYLSPDSRADREYCHRVAAVYARQRETPEERYQRELATSDWHQTQAQWRQRVYDALVWWSSQGEKLTSDSNYLLVLIRERRSDYPSYESLLAKYQNPDDPCSTPQRAEQVAAWALANLPDLIAEHVAQVSERTVPRLTRILRYHHKRDVVIFQETRAYELNRGIEALRGESAEQLVQRLLKELDGIAIAREKGTKRIQDVAATLKPEAQGEYIRTATAGINALLDAWMFARTKVES